MQFYQKDELHLLAIKEAFEMLQPQHCLHIISYCMSSPAILFSLYSFSQNAYTSVLYSPLSLFPLNFQKNEDF